MYDLCYHFIIVKSEMPKFLKKPENIECMEFDDITFKTTVRAKPLPQIEWFKSDEKLIPSDRITYGNEGEEFILSIKEVKKDEAGMFSVKATNDQGSMSASARLKVTGKLTVKILHFQFTNGILITTYL